MVGIRIAMIASASMFILAFVTVRAAPHAPQAAARSTVPSLTGATLYQDACAACHGLDGKGQERSVVGFDIPLPDFTDCSFASREPDADWLAVAHDGGPVRGFDATMPAFGAALSEADLLLILGHIRTMCGDPAWPRGELNLPRTFFTEKAYPEDEAVLTTGFNTSGAGAWTNTIVYEKRFGPRNQIELKVPLGAMEGVGGTWMGGAGDIALGFKRAIAHSLERGHIFALAGEIILPTGDESAGLGTGTAVFEPFASYGQALPADAFVQAQAGLELPFDTNRADREAFWRVAFGKTFTQGAFGRAWSPMVEVLAAREFGAGHRVHWDIAPQMQVTLNTRQHLMINVGVRTPLNARAGRSTQLLVYFLWDWFDGGLRDGW